MRNPIKVFGRSFQRTVSNTRTRTREDVENEVARKTIRRIATGNVRLQRGQYSTKEDTNKRWERVKDHSFADESN